VRRTYLRSIVNADEDVGALLSQPEPMIRRVLVLTGGLLAVMTANASARQAGSMRADSVTVVPGEQYGAGFLHRWLLGSHYRDAWTTALRVPVLDLGSFAGGLSPTERGGGFQTKSLRFLGGDGKEYAFRSVDKDPSAILPADLRETLVDDIIQDQISSGHPAAALMVTPIIEAAGVLHVHPQLVVMPDDPRLGEFRAEFAGMLGTIEERPEEGTDSLPGFRGADNVVGTERLLERLEEDVEFVDARAFLAARLLDVFLGDWDRHRDQWQWARFGEGVDALWQPIPRDRDQAFVMLDGLLLMVARQYYPQLVKYDDNYPDPLGITWNGRELDRRLLVGLEWPAWDSTATVLQAKLTDTAIDSAIRALPPELQRVDGERLRHSMQARRAGLRDFARRFYELLAEDIEVHTTDAPEVANVRRISDDTMEIEVTARLPDGRTLRVFRRTFYSNETDEVRLDLHGGRDSVYVSGTGDGVILRALGGGNDDVFVDASPSGSDRFYDSAGENVFVRGGGTHVDEREYVYPGPPYSPSQPPRDWGQLYRFPLWMLYAPDVGLLAGVGIHRIGYGFRQYPYMTSVGLRGAIGTTARTFRVELDARLNRENSPRHWTLSAYASGLEVLRFHGFGNETEITEEDAFYQVDQRQFSLESRFVMPFANAATLSVGPAIRYARTDRDSARLITALEPYGAGRFGQVGVRADVLLDLRDRERAASRGVAFTLGGDLWPAVWSVTETFGRIHGEAMAYLTPPIPLRPTLALRAGGRRLLGTYPFSDAAYLGDDETIRLGRKQRFAGDAEVHLNAELRVKLFRTKVVLPADFGVFGLRETGRVFLDGEDSDRWHNVWGGGLFVAFLQPSNTLSVAVARSAERTGIYIGAGFAW
jgi:hypothetical protein